jgi:hypothetical protein
MLAHTAAWVLWIGIFSARLLLIHIPGIPPPAPVASLILQATSADTTTPFFSRRHASTVQSSDSHKKRPTAGGTL